MMKPLHSFMVAAALVVGLAGVAEGRLVRTWPEEELLAKSDLVVVATPTATHDTGEHVSPFMGLREAFGVETTFMISAVLKGHLEKKTLALHHYRDNPEEPRVDGPEFVAFDPAGKRSFHLYLIRERDGRYAPVTGQQDPGLSVFDASKKLGAPPPKRQ